jgi:hypothetical protein
MNNQKMRDLCTKILEQMEQCRGPKNLAALSGSIPENGLNAFIKLWELPRQDMGWCFWEKVSGVGVELMAMPSINPKDEFWLDWFYVFGKAGHLTIQRMETGNLWQWHFVGNPKVPPKQLDAANYWEQPKAPEILHQWSKTVVLWGVQNKTRSWKEDRVAKAVINYHCPEWTRLQLRYNLFTSAGQEELVWFCGLEELK